MIREDLYELPLEKGMGFLVVGVICPEEIEMLGGEKGYSHLLNVYREVSNTPFKKNQEFSQLSELMPPFVLARKPKSRGKQKWRKIGSRSLEEYRLPEFYSCYSDFYKKHEEEEWWDIISRIYSNEKRSSEYNKVSHLMPWLHINFSGLATIITMYFIKNNGKEILDYYSLRSKETSSDDEFIEEVYYWILNLPDYSKVPQEIRWVENKNKIDIQ
ncbi:Imm26 family immunity protein [Flammeovirga sp. SJP92]|uniref:Imm26 family immunity protein n=1 Tax=Flammeovirga sp. SJP92 TaxID=1775430 RepID=UPI000788E337|nr:Imm26 family immunity protein [Flammeovirga sp. SJP92]KXX68749.1 hypothetical protein AVL50_18935 [Flammeovirga sp. SJP92]